MSQVWISVELGQQVGTFLDYTIGHKGARTSYDCPIFLCVNDPTLVAEPNGVVRAPNIHPQYAGMRVGMSQTFDGSEHCEIPLSKIAEMPKVEKGVWTTGWFDFIYTTRHAIDKIEKHLKKNPKCVPDKLHVVERHNAVDARSLFFESQASDIINHRYISLVEYMDQLQDVTFSFFIEFEDRLVGHIWGWFGDIPIINYVWMASRYRDYTKWCLAEVLKKLPNAEFNYTDCWEGAGLARHKFWLGPSRFEHYADYTFTPRASY